MHITSLKLTLLKLLMSWKNLISCFLESFVDPTISSDDKNLPDGYKLIFANHSKTIM